MVNIWNYVDATDIAVYTKQKVYVGDVISVEDEEESAEEREVLTIFTKQGKYVGLYPEEITKIVRL